MNKFEVEMVAKSPYSAADIDAAKDLIDITDPKFADAIVWAAEGAIKFVGLKPWHPMFRVAIIGVAVIQYLTKVRGMSKDEIEEKHADDITKFALYHVQHDEITVKELFVIAPTDDAGKPLVH